MAADIMREADVNLMKLFGEWFKQQVAGGSNPWRILEDITSYYATAFEFVAIGAAHLDSYQKQLPLRRLDQSVQNAAEKLRDHLLKTFERRLRDKGFSVASIDTNI